MHTGLDSKHASGIPSTVNLYLIQHSRVSPTDIHDPLDLEEYVVVDGGRDQGESILIPLLWTFF